ncbi:MAG TPA: flavin reductase family protein [Chloroflexota bacterium]|nr:flavin reductase family protein [Chloroflexota bacterium]
MTVTSPPLVPIEPASPEAVRKALRKAWGQFATGVTVVGVRDGTGLHGMTANSFTSVSLNPPLVLISIDRQARTHALLEREGRYAVSILGEEQRAWADRFAGRQGDLQHQFEDVPHHLTEDGLPIIEGALASFVCRVCAIHPAGDHSLFIAEVERFQASPGAAPLVFFRGHYRSIEGDD